MATLLRKPGGGTGSVSPTGSGRIATDLSVSALSRSGFTCTATSTAHGFSVNDQVVVSGAVEPDFNGQFTVLTTADADTFTYNSRFSGTLTATGTIVARLHPDLRGMYMESRIGGVFRRYYMAADDGTNQTYDAKDVSRDGGTDFALRYGGLRA